MANSWTKQIYTVKDHSANKQVHYILRHQWLLCLQTIVLFIFFCQVEVIMTPLKERLQEGGL